MQKFKIVFFIVTAIGLCSAGEPALADYRSNYSNYGYHLQRGHTQQRRLPRTRQYRYENPGRIDINSSTATSSCNGISRSSQINKTARNGSNNYQISTSRVVCKN